MVHHVNISGSSSLVHEPIFLSISSALSVLEGEMINYALLGDAWIREAEEASRMIEDIETRIKDKNPEQRLRDSARWKLLELGPKLDRLESLLHNPPAKPILTDQDLDLRRNMLSEIQLRTRAMALSLYALQFTNSPGNLPTLDTKEAAKTSCYDQEHIKVSLSKQDNELLTPLVSDDSIQSQLQSSFLVSKRWLLKACWVVFVILGAAALLFILHLLGSFIAEGRGIYILYEDVKSCPYEDVHVLWSILVESQTPPLPSKQ
ncbi:hypothetical protein HHK36_012654 [Tetracentron sinense]|uniref:Uncharacterized protein n=1 Tax=Tetracentron sinense TaxID=13715 RepID=A0A834ZAR1_TETSI|nr:hypothetical protein HHK36_012654 [Tetracentron sinense]